MTDVLDSDLRDVLDGAQRDARELVEEQERRRAEGRQLRAADELIATLMRFEVQLTEARVQREQARRNAAVHDEAYDQSVLAAEAAVLNLCAQLLDMSFRHGDDDDAEAVLARLDRGLDRVRADRAEALEHGWMYRREKKMIALREIGWQRAVKQAKRRARHA